MPRNDLQELMQLAQLSQLLAGPQVQQQELQQRGENSRLQSALAILGLQQQAEAGAAERALREQQMEQSGQQFEADLGIRRDDMGLRSKGLEFQQGRATADDAFRGEDLDFRRTLAAGETADRAMAREQEGEKMNLQKDLAMKQLIAGLFGEGLTNPAANPRLQEAFATDLGPEYGGIYKNAREEQARVKDATLLAQMQATSDPATKNMLTPHLSPEGQKTATRTGKAKVGGFRPGALSFLFK